ncbi:MAG: hypothetical protein HFI14_14040 [Lachnospiraceae bacterium]|nr:hypothetical protein [Lachnospiraceae bacterium]
MRTPPGNSASATAAKSMTGMQAGMPPLRAERTACKRNGREKIQYDIFSGFLSGLEEVWERPEYRVCTRYLRLLFWCV